MSQNKDDSVNYIKAIVYVFIALGLFIGALLGAYFAGVGLYFGQGIVEQDVFTNQYKFECGTSTQTQATCTNFTTTELNSWTDYQAFRDDINATIPLFIGATVVLFSLLALVFLFLALRTSGLIRWGGSGSSMKDEF